MWLPVRDDRVLPLELEAVYSSSQVMHGGRGTTVVIREVRLLLAELGRLNTDVVPLAMRIMDDCATVEEHYAFAERLAALAQQFRLRATHMDSVIDGEVTSTTDADGLWQPEHDPALGSVRDG